MITPTLDLTQLELKAGGHTPPPAGCGKTPDMCLFEAYNMLLGRDFSASCPPGVSTVLHAVGMRLNDRLPDAKRQALKEFLPRPDGTSPLDGTASDSLDEARTLMAANWAVHTATRTWLRQASLTQEEAALDAIPPITSRAALTAALPAIRSLSDSLWARRRAVYDDLRAKAADAAAAAAAVADAAAVAVADAAAVAAAAAVADAAAVAVADAAAVAVADPRSETYSKVRKAAYDAAKQAIDAKHGPTIAEIEDSAIALYRAMIRPETTAATPTPS